MRFMTGKGYDTAEVIGKYKVQYDEDDRDMRILLLDPSKPCVSMAIDKINNDAVLDFVRYGPDCTVDSRMMRGEGTREMIEFSLNLLKSKGATTVSLSDKTKIDCNGIAVSLGPMYFLKYGMTWYEKYFGFQPASRFQESYSHAKKKRAEVLDIEYVSAQPCEYFDDKTIREAFRVMELVDFYNYEWVKKL